MRCFIGAIISLSSTMVATRTLAESGQRYQPFAQLVVGLLVAEDMLAIVMLTMLTAVAIGGSVQAETAFTLIGHLGLFVVVGMILGLLLLPRLVDYVAGFGRDETLLVSVLGICFGASLFAAWMGFSVALGAFLAGAVVAESRSVGRVLHLVEPLRDMFAALFFVAIGLRIDPAMLLQYALPALLIALSRDRRQDAGMQPGHFRRRPRCAHGAALGAGHGADRRVLVRDRHARAFAGRDQRLHLSDRGRGIGSVHGGVAVSEPFGGWTGEWSAPGDTAFGTVAGDQLQRLAGKPQAGQRERGDRSDVPAAAVAHRDQRAAGGEPVHHRRLRQCAQLELVFGCSASIATCGIR